MARGLCNVFPGLALALRLKPGNLGAKLGHFLLAFRVLVEAAHPDIADAVILHPICQEELYNPGREVSINPNENSILTPQRPVPDVRLAARGKSLPWGQSALFRNRMPV